MTQMTLDGLPEFRTIVIDWPWDERGGCGRGTKYPTIRTLTELHRVVVESPAWRPAADAHLYVWQTVTHIEEPHFRRRRHGGASPGRRRRQLGAATPRFAGGAGGHPRGAPLRALRFRRILRS